MVVCFQIHFLFVNYLLSGLVFPVACLSYPQNCVFPISINAYIVHILLRPPLSFLLL